MEEYNPKWQYVKGLENSAADALSRLEMTPKFSDIIDWEPRHNKMTYSQRQQIQILCQNINAISNAEADDDSEDLLVNDEVSESQSRFFVQDEYMDMEFALDVKMFKEHQDRDQELQKKLKTALKNDNSSYSNKNVEGTDLIHFNNKIVVPSTLRQRVMEWYHKVLCHPGGVRMDCTMRGVYTWLNMRQDIYEFCKTCPTCQKCKKSFTNKYGFLPQKEAESTKWSRVNLDCWGPKTIKMYIMVMTMKLDY